MAGIPTVILQEDHSDAAEVRRDQEEIVEGNEEQSAQQEDNPSLVFVVAGHTRSGKSCLLNNIFDLDFESRCSDNTSVTSKIKSFRIIKERYTLIIVDTPGLAAEDIPTSQVRKEFFSVVGDLNYTLLYCRSVAPGSSETNKKVLKALQDTLGKNIWKNCILFLTFSDNLHQAEIFDRKVGDPDKYLDLLRGHVEKFSTVFRKQCGKKVPEVKLIFDDGYDTGDKIVAVPVGRKVNDGPQIIPAKDGIEQPNWKELAFILIFQKSEALQSFVKDPKKHLISPKNQAKIGITAGVLTGAGLGALSGGVIGGALGGLGAIPGAGFGALAGAIAGVLSAGGMGGGLLSYAEANKKRLSDKAEKLFASDLVEIPTADRAIDIPTTESVTARSPPVPIHNSHTQETPGDDISSTYPGATVPPLSRIPRSKDKYHDLNESFESSDSQISTIPVEASPELSPEYVQD